MVLFLNATMPDDNEIGQFLVTRALSAFGIATEKEIQSYLQPDSARDSDLRVTSKETISKALLNLVERNKFVGRSDPKADRFSLTR